MALVSTDAKRGWWEGGLHVPSDKILKKKIDKILPKGSFVEFFPNFKDPSTLNLPKKLHNPYPWNFNYCTFRLFTVLQLIRANLLNFFFCLQCWNMSVVLKCPQKTFFQSLFLFFVIIVWLLLFGCLFLFFVLLPKHQVRQV